MRKNSGKSSGLESDRGVDSEVAVESDASDRVGGLPSAVTMENILNQGIGFLSGLMEMATGKKLLADGQSVTVNQEAGEVTMKFKLPGF